MTPANPTYPDVVTGGVAGNDDAAFAGGTELEPYNHALFPDLLSQDPAAVRERFARRFMAAESIDDLFNVLEGTTSKDMVGRVVTVEQVSWAPFQSDRGLIPLAICKAADATTGEVLEFATTSEALTMFIRRAEVIGALPFTAQIKAQKTRGGNTALNFARA